MGCCGGVADLCTAENCSGVSSLRPTSVGCGEDVVDLGTDKACTLGCCAHVVDLSPASVGYGEVDRILRGELDLEVDAISLVSVRSGSTSSPSLMCSSRSPNWRVLLELKIEIKQSVVYNMWVQGNV